MEDNYSLEYFVDKKAAETFICTICYNVPSGASIVDHGKCGAVFCFSCISLWLKKKQKCPKCNETFTKLEHAKENNRLLYSIIQNLKVRCPYNSPHCQWVGDLADLPKHLVEDQKKTNMIDCPYKAAGCNTRSSEEIIAKHLVDAAKIHAEKFLEFANKKEIEIQALMNQNKLLKNAGAPSAGIFGGFPLANPTSFMTAPKLGNPVVYLNIKIQDTAEARIVFHLFADIVPKTVENFRQLCIGSFKTLEGRVLTYKGNVLHRIIPEFMFQGGDIINENGTGSQSIYGKNFPDENFALKHHKAGILSMANAGPNTNGSQFFVTFKECPWLDGKHVVFGEVIQGQEFVKEIEKYGAASGCPTKKIWISDCGQFT